MNENRNEKGQFTAISEQEKLERQIREAQARLAELKKIEADKALAEKKRIEEERAAVRKADADKVNAAYKKYYDLLKQADELYKEYLKERNEFVKKYGYFHQSFNSDDGMYKSIVDVFNEFFN